MDHPKDHSLFGLGLLGLRWGLGQAQKHRPQKSNIDTRYQTYGHISKESTFSKAHHFSGAQKHR